ILIDTGAGVPEYMPLLVSYLERRGWARPERILLTHRHRDHLGGVAHLAERFPGIAAAKMIVNDSDLPPGIEDLPDVQPLRGRADVAPPPHAGTPVTPPLLLPHRGGGAPLRRPDLERLHHGDSRRGRRPRPVHGLAPARAGPRGQAHLSGPRGRDRGRGGEDPGGPRPSPAPRAASPGGGRGGDPHQPPDGPGELPPGARRAPPARGGGGGPPTEETPGPRGGGRGAR